MHGSQKEGVLKLFLPQKTLEDWALSEKADLMDGKLVVKEPKSSHTTTPAVHFTRIVSGEDAQSLVGRVKTLEQIAQMGGEHMSDSVIIGELAYEVVEGYITEVPVAPKADAKKKSGSPEADLLAAFILDKL